MLLRNFTMMLAVVLALAFLNSEANAQVRRALIIGNAQYEDLPDLQNTIDDAGAYRDTFSQLGYEVSFYQDLDLDRFSEALDTFTASIESGDTVVVVYAGHGWSDGRENFLIPTDAPVSGSETKLRGASFPLRDGQNGLLDLIDAAGASLTVAIIDACRNNPFTAKSGTRASGFTRGLAPVSAPQGSFVIFSAGEGQEALDRLPDDSPGQTLSVFTRNLAPLLQSGAYLEDAVAEAQLETAAMAATVDGHLQHPAYYDQTLGKTCLSAQCDDPEQVAINLQPQTPSQQPATKTFDEQNPLILACDTLAHNSGNPDNPNGVPGISLSEMDGAAAERACAAAVAQFPDHLRSSYNLARTKAALEDNAAGFALYQVLAGKQYPAGIFGLADAYEFGSGTTANSSLALRYYDTACKSGHKTSCTLFGDLLFGTAQNTDDTERGLKIMLDNCNAGAGIACELAAFAVRNLPEHAKEELPLFQKSCELDHAPGCAQAAYLELQDSNFASALENYTRACDGNVNWACRDLGVMFENGQGTTADVARAESLYEKACTLKDGTGCANRGWLHSVAEDHSKANPFFEQGCALENGPACTNMGFQHEKGFGTAPDIQEAIRYYELGCNFGNGIGCDNLGGLHYPPARATEDPELALEYYKKGCELNTASSCRSAGVIIFDGITAAADQTLGMTYLEKSCELDLGQGCNAVGNYLEKQKVDTPEAKARIVETYQKGCDLGWGNACADLASGYINGVFGLTKDLTKALSLYEMGCNMPNSAYACDRFAGSITEKTDAQIYVDAALKACDGGYGDRCSELALFDYGPDKPRAAVDLLVQGLQLKSELVKSSLSSLDKTQITVLQQALGQLGFYQGAADGKRGPATIAALDAVYAQ